MFLKALTLRGFKSFASATTLRLEPGITCIVGPNGSGKSNVVDALTWVMGEQGAKSLRGANMSDVIFAGTSGRAALGRAQVELTIDNSDGRLPIDYSEVTISRTLFRGGGSEYAINSAPARLLDVQELLSDTGMGKQMHVIVGQGQLDAVLRASAEERRGFIDEAAGVLKHRRRKERALRKLESMDGNLVRVLDLTEEIRRQLKPLARQAKAAREAAGVQERIDIAQKRLLADDLLTARARIERDREEVLRFRTQVSGQSAAIQQIRELLSAKEQQTGTLQATLQQFTELWHQLDSLQERLSSVVVVAGERLNQAQSRGNLVTEASIELAQEKAAETAAAAQQAQQAVEVGRTAVDQATSQREQAEREESRRSQELRAKEDELARQQREYSVVREAVVAATSQAEASRSAADRAEEHWKDSAARVEQVRETAKDLNLVEGLQDTPPNDGHQSLAEQHSARVEDEQAARRELERIQSEERDLRAQVASWQARRDALAQSLTSVNHQQATSDPGQKWEPLATLDEHLTAQRGWEEAISALISPFETAAIVHETDSIAAGLDAARSGDEPLRALFVGDTPDGSMVPLGPPASGDSFPAAAIVKVSQALEKSVGHLLDKCWLAPDLASAQQTLAQQPRDIVIAVATPDGVVVTRESVRSPGDDTSSNLLTRAQWQDASEEAATHEERLAQTKIALEAARATMEAATEAAKQALTQLREADVQQAKIAEERARVAARIGAAEDEEVRARTQLEESRKRSAVAAEELIVAEAKAKELPTIRPEEFLAEVRQAVTAAADVTRQAREKEMADKLALRGAEEQLRSATRQADAFRSQVEQLRQTRIEQSRREEVLQQARQALGKIKLRAEEAREEALDRVETANRRRLQLEEAGRAADEEIRSLRSKLENLQWEQNHAGETRQQAEVAFAQSRLQYDQLLQRAVELTGEELPEAESDEPLAIAELSESLEKLVSENGPDQPVLDHDGELIPYSRAAMSASLEKAQRELSRLGVVNPLAVEEHAALSTRHDFLTEQVADLKKSKADLMSIVADVDHRVKVAFEEAFADTQAQFEHVFSVLFPGGTGRLSLTDPDDPLHTGVEIYARPVGKRVTRLSLLSGGERSLAALAYLVAIFKARPSPFYVMDEVEAALDDINLSRVLQIFGELREASQLILVTHQKRTMEIADALYGVTMKEGTTAVVSHRLSDKKVS